MMGLLRTMRRAPARLLASVVAIALAVGAIGVFAVPGVIFILWLMVAQIDDTDIAKLQAGVALLALLVGALHSGWRLLVRQRRSRLLEQLYAIRDLAHAVDLMQVSQPTEQYLIPGEASAASPKRHMTDFELSRYLVYCTFLLSCLGLFA